MIELSLPLTTITKKNYTKINPSQQRGFLFHKVFIFYMKNIIRHILKEETNKSLKLFTNLYDIEDNGSIYRGENRFQTYVTFYPKDYNNEMTREAGTSICNWEIDDDGELIFKFMSLPQPYLIPLMNYVGDTEDLEDYLEDIHVEEAEKFLKRINHRRNNPLKEDVDKNKRFLTKLLGEDLINSIQEITSPKQLPIEFLKSIGTSIIQRYIDEYGPLYYFVLDGEPFIYKDRESPKGEKYEMYCNNKGKTFLEGEITDRLGLSDMGLRFSDVIDTIFNKEEPLNEDVDKDKKFLNNVMGVDFTGKFKQITSAYDVPYKFYRNGGITMPDVASYLNRFGPMYIIELYGRKFIYQDRGRYESFISEDGIVYEDKIPEQLGIDVMGLRFSDIIDIYFNEGEI
jgi:hypothetical protein